MVSIFDEYEYTVVKNNEIIELQCNDKLKNLWILNLDHTSYNDLIKKLYENLNNKYELLKNS